MINSPANLSYIKQLQIKNSPSNQPNNPLSPKSEANGTKTKNLKFSLSSLIPKKNDIPPNAIPVYIAGNKEEQQKSLYGLITTIISLGVAFCLIKKMNGDKLKGEVKPIWEDVSNAMGLKDMALPDKMKDIVSKLKNSFSNPQRVVSKGGEITRNGILLYGPPGTGKTTFAKALSKEFPNGKFVNINMTNLDSQYVSVTEKNTAKFVNSVCVEADKDPSSIFVVFLDEADSVFMVDTGSGAKYSTSVLNTFKTCINDKLLARKNIVTIAACNADIDPEVSMKLYGKKLDAAIADRLEKIKIDLPTQEQFAQTIANHYKDCNVAQELKDANSELVQRCSKRLADSHETFRTLNEVFKNAPHINFDSETLSKEDFLTALEMQIKNCSKLES